MKAPMVVLATTNQGKAREIKKILKDAPIEIRDLTDFGPIPEAVEDGDTFDENAYKKALHTARMLGIPAIADDSGLAVEALDGRPGVLSARYGGPGLDDFGRAKKLLEEMQGKQDRRAAFLCVVSVAVPSGPALTYEARVDGVITTEPSGSNGFGYDPVFFYEPFGKTFAELTAEEKNAVSHRGKAFAELAGEMDKVAVWLNQQMTTCPSH